MQEEPEGLLPVPGGGWPQGGGTAAPGAHLLPAYAGMTPRSLTRCFVRNAAPRARRDDPTTRSSPKSGCAAPRTRGDGPDEAAMQVIHMPCSPRTRA
ncbi:hypothetical protein CP970_40690 [Streptomyces kanamyceticus]|uniref:Uncharacterized protein n=1 Tax=Streptomyces kanamyceticus TaxID=1967 RepID=A0A5J6GQU0_STRKN|nr:hypothetical protein CP970_40690 [Streptomyces kanamyceticus]